MIEIQFSGHGLEITEAMRDFVYKKFNRLSKHFDNILSVHVFFIIEKLKQAAEATIHVPNFEIYAKAQSEDMYKTIDLLTDKLLRQLDKHKEKIQNK